MNLQKQIEITETPRDAMQGWPNYIPPGIKARYINALLKVGFHTIDCGSFVSAKAVPQMADTAEVIRMIDISNTKTNLMVIAGNTRGGLMASSENKIHTIAYPYSVSNTFLRRNLNTTPEKAWDTVLKLKNICIDSEKELRVYITMAFGNPYGEDCNDEIVAKEVDKLYQVGIFNIVLSDTTGLGTPDSIGRLCAFLVRTFPDVQPGIHLHTKPNDWQNKIDSAWESGIRRFESAMGGYGGCPMTGYELLANLDTLDLAGWCNLKRIPSNINEEVLREAQLIATEVYV
jgi:hydroxymethylglutaryl-CoA lyase